MKYKRARFIVEVREHDVEGHYFVFREFDEVAEVNGITQPCMIDWDGNASEADTVEELARDLFACAIEQFEAESAIEQRVADGSEDA